MADEAKPDPKPTSRKESPTAEVPNEFTQNYLVVCERQKSIRIGIIAVAICICVWVIASSIVKVMDQDKSPWLVFGLAAIGPSGIVATILKTWHSYVKNKNKRMKDLEVKVDPKRTSSGLEEDGRSKYGL